MQVLVTGANGMLGKDLVEELAVRSLEPIATDVEQLDITDPVSVGGIASGQYGSVDWIVNCAAYTAVDRAETEVQKATEVNALGPGYLSKAASMANAKLIHLSTDFVFDGTATEPYSEEAPTNPLGIYGRTKLEGERTAAAANMGTLIVRTSWLYGPKGPSFPQTMIRAYEAGRTLRVVADQRGNPTYTADLARVLVDLIELDPMPGVYHASGPETMSWHELARLAIDTWSGQSVPIEALSTTDWPTAAKRPAYSALSTAKLASLGIKPMRSCAVAMKEYCERLRGLI